MKCYIHLLIIMDYISNIFEITANSSAKIKEKGLAPSSVDKNAQNSGSVWLTLRWRSYEEQMESIKSFISEVSWCVASNLYFC